MSPEISQLLDEGAVVPQSADSGVGHILLVDLPQAEKTRPKGILGFVDAVLYGPDIANCLGGVVVLESIGLGGRAKVSAIECCSDEQTLETKRYQVGTDRDCFKSAVQLTKEQKQVNRLVNQVGKIDRQLAEIAATGVWMTINLNKPTMGWEDFRPEVMDASIISSQISRLEAKKAELEAQLNLVKV